MKRTTSVIRESLSGSRLTQVFSISRVNVYVFDEMTVKYIAIVFEYYVPSSIHRD